MVNASGYGFGICLVDGSNLCQVFQYGYSSNGFQVADFNNGSYVSLPSGGNVGSFYVMNPLWLRVVDDGTNRTYYTSFDGYYFWQLYQTGSTTYLTPTKVGLTVSNCNAFASPGRSPIPPSPWSGLVTLHAVAVGRRHGALLAADSHSFPPRIQWGGPGRMLETNRFMRIQLRIEDGRIRASRFGTHGCAPAIAAGDCLCGLVEGATLEDAALWEATALIEALGGLPESRLYSAELAVKALHLALEDGRRRREEKT